MRAISVREAVPDDAPAIADIHVRGWKQAYQGIIPDEVLAPLSVAQRQRFWEGEIAEPPHGHATFVAERDGAVIAFASAGPSRDPDAEGAGELYAIYAAPEAWGAGSGRALDPEVRAHLKDRDHHEATLWVLTQNDRARRFYERTGWFADGGTKSENWRDLVTLEEVRYRTRL